MHQWTSCQALISSVDTLTGRDRSHGNRLGVSRSAPPAPHLSTSHCFLKTHKKDSCIEAVGCLHFLPTNTGNHELHDFCDDGELAGPRFAIARLPYVALQIFALIRYHADMLPISRPHQTAPRGRRSLHVCAIYVHSYLQKWALR
jgi:hypothetical protein